MIFKLNLNDLKNKKFLKNDISIFKSIINIVNISNNKTTINIKGHLIDVPFILDKNKKYLAKINNNILEIFEIKIKNYSELHNSNNIKNIDLINFFDILYNQHNERNDLIINFFNFLHKQNSEEKIYKKLKNNFYYFNNDKNDFIFLFNYDFYNIPSKFLIKINLKKEICLNIYMKEKNKYPEKDNIIDNIKKEFSNKLNFISINIFFDKLDFYKNISNLIQNNIDLII